MSGLAVTEIRAILKFDQVVHIIFIDYDASGWSNADAALYHQLDLKDTYWLMNQLGDVCKRCEFCVVLPAGLQRLVDIQTHQSTTWMTGNWTLQEMVLSPKCSAFSNGGMAPGSCSLLPRQQQAELHQVIGIPLHHFSLVSLVYQPYDMTLTCIKPRKLMLIWQT